MKSLPINLTDAVLFPVRLLKITRLDGTVYRIAESEIDIVCDDERYTALEGGEFSAVEHTLGGAMPSMQLKFTHSVGGTFDTAAIANGLFDGANVLLYLADRKVATISYVTSNALTILTGKGLLFTGTIQPISYDNYLTGTFDIRGQASEAQSIVQTYAPMCRTDLFSSLCTVDRAAYAQHGTIDTIITKFDSTISGLASPPDGWFNLGVGVTDGGITFEIANWVLSTRKLTTFLPRCALFTAGEGVTLYPGCDKTIATCKAKFNNNLNFQGEPHFAGHAAVSAVGPTLSINGGSF
jgi:uncharacterized phage protein (TIGR02218 family)